MIERIVDLFGSKRAAVVTACLVTALLAWLSTYRTPLSRVWADEGTFLAMTASLALDGDLRFTDADLARLDTTDPGRASLILERTELGIAYSKPVVLPLAAAPFWALFGDAGLVVLNAVALLFSLWLTHRYLQRLRDPDGDGADPLWVVTTFVFAAVVLPYVFWRMADLLQLALTLTGLVLCFARLRSPGPHSPSDVRPGLRDRILDHPAAPWLGVALVAITTNMRLSNGALILIPVLAELFAGRFRRAVASGLVGAATVAAAVGLTFLLTGALDPYRAERTTFMPSTGYPAGADANVALERFDIKPATHVNTMARGSQIAYAAAYFWLGRHSGLLIYFPAVVVFLWVAVRRSDARTWACLLGAGVVLAFFIAWKPVNYFGGATFIGNRYFLSIYPAFLLAMARRPSRRALALVWLVAAAVYASATWSILTHHDVDPGSQSHVRGGWLAALPYESTSRSLDDTLDRYWTGQFVRFLDPMARVTKDSFELQAGRSTDVLIAQWQEPGTLRFMVEAEADEATLVVEDWRRSRRYAVGRALAPERGLVGIDVETAVPWRRHGFWFEQQPYWTRLLRLRLDAPPGTTARLHHLGDPQLAAAAFKYEALDMQPPTRAVAGTADTVMLRVRNSSSAIWQPNDVTAVTGRFRVLRGESVLTESGRIALSGSIDPGGTLELPIEVRWPDVTGVVTLELDLVLEHIDWFKSRLGHPVLRAEVELSEPPSSPGP